MCRAPNLRNIVGDTSPTSVASLANLQLCSKGDAETAFEVTSEQEEFDVDLRVPSPSGDGKSSIELVLRHTAAVAHGKWFAVGRRHEELVEAMWLPVETPAAAPSGRVARLLARLPSLQSARGRLSLACSAFVLWPAAWPAWWLAWWPAVAARLYVLGHLCAQMLQRLGRGAPATAARRAYRLCVRVRADSGGGGGGGGAAGGGGERRRRVSDELTIAA